MIKNQVFFVESDDLGLLLQILLAFIIILVIMLTVMGLVWRFYQLYTDQVTTQVLFPYPLLRTIVF